MISDEERQLRDEWEAILKAEGLPAEPRRKALPADPLWSGGTLDKSSGRRPLTALESLMQTDLYEEPVTSLEELQEGREAVLGLLDLLDERERFVVTEMVLCGATLVATAKTLGVAKNTCRVILERALLTMQEAIEGKGKR